MTWSLEIARKHYNILNWGEGYYDINTKGQIIISSGKKIPPIALTDLVYKLKEHGLNLPVLVRFPDLLHQRVLDLYKAFEKAIKKHRYKGKYHPIYPIKVNQHKSVVSSIINTKNVNVGLEAGSKAELVAVLSIAKLGSTVICNGYKDAEYIKLALIGTALGHKVYIVIEKPSEIPLIVQLSRSLNICPLLGIRIRLATLGIGKWQNSGGEKAKFGLTAKQIIELIDFLRKEKFISSLKLLHFHMGSQISDIKHIHQGIREAMQFFIELQKLGVNIDILDVGGGLGIDYEGTRSRSDCSINYDMEIYANHVISALSESCKNIAAPPQIVTEAGRAMTAHHAVLLVPIIDEEDWRVNKQFLKLSGKTPLVLRELIKILNVDFTKCSVVELYNDTNYWLSQAHTLFVHGVVDLKQRACAEQISYAIWAKIHKLLQPELRAHRNIYDEINHKLINKIFGNFSVFRSVPDVWALDQIFPILPLEGLIDPPTKRCFLEDITCDSDGCFKYYIDGQGIEGSIPLPNSVSKNSTILGIFLIGAYQDILGDKHNLFGKTHSIEVLYKNGAYQIQKTEPGETIAEILKEVDFDKDFVLNEYKRKFVKASLSQKQKQVFFKFIQKIMHNYTYLSKL